MSEVKRYGICGFEGGVIELKDGHLVHVDDFDRVTAERDAALAENKLLRHDVASYLETVAKVCDMLGVDLESAKSAEGNPSDVLFGYVSSMQQRLTAADERADVLEGLLLSLPDGLKDLSGCENTAGVVACIQYVEYLIGEIKPAEGGGDDA